MSRASLLRTRSRSRVPGAVAVALSFFASSAFADEGEAERLFREGRALMLDGRFDEACPMLEQSQKLDPHVGTLLNVAACHERQGKVGSAWVEYQKALTAARAEGQADRAQLAEERIAVLEPRVPWLRISTAMEDVTITLDGGELAPAALGQEMPVDPGVRAVVAERRGVKVFEARVALRESERRSVRVVAEQGADVRPDPGRSDPERLVIEPKPEVGPPRVKDAKDKGRWIFEPGVFVGYLGGTASSPRLDNPQGVSLTPIISGQQTESCASRTCKVGEASAGDVAVGINVFGGYAFSDQLDLGVRILAAPATGSVGAFGFGPSLVLHPTESLSLGLWGLFGDASVKGAALVTGPPEFSSPPQRTSAEGSLAGAIGAGVELSLRLFDLGRGKVVANTTPFFLAGNGIAYGVPFGVAYHFQ